MASRFDRSVARWWYLLAVGGLLACGRGGNAALSVPGAADAGPVRVTFAVAQGRQVHATLSLTGTLVPEQQSAVTPLVAGRVDEVLVERGTIVHEGDVLLRLRDVDYRANAASANAALQQTEARLGLDHGQYDAEQTAEVRAARANRDLAEDALRRSQQLAQSGAISDQDLQRITQQALAAREQYSATVNNSRAAFFAYRNARVAVDQTRRSVSDSAIRAPFGGEIAERSANVGEYVTPQRPVLVLVRTNPLRLELQIPQDRIAFVQRGQDVLVRVDAFPNRPFHGTVRYISASVRADTRSLIAEAVVPNDDGVLRPGIFVSARLQLDQRADVVAVPSTAVVTEAGTSRAYVIRDNVVEERILTVSDRTENEVLVSRGLAANERVATSRLERLSDGARIVQ